MVTWNDWDAMLEALHAIAVPEHHRLVLVGDDMTSASRMAKTLASAHKWAWEEHKLNVFHRGLTRGYKEFMRHVNRVGVDHVIVFHDGTFVPGHGYNFATMVEPWSDLKRLVEKGTQSPPRLGIDIGADK